MSGMRGGRGRVSSGDIAAQRAANASAPKVDGLFSRIAALFLPYRVPLITTGVLVVVGAGLSVLPPLLTQQAFDRGLFPEGGPDFPVLIGIVALMVAIYLVSGALGVWQTWLTSTVGWTCARE